MAAELRQELVNTNAQLEKQKSLKEVFIKKEKEVRQELERIQRYSEADTLRTASIASHVQVALKHKKKKVLQQEYEELKVSYVVSQEKLSSELQLEKEKTLELQKYLDEAKNLNDQLSLEVASLSQESLKFQEESEENRRLLEAEKNKSVLLQQNMSEQIEALTKNAPENEIKMMEELQQMKTAYQDLKVSKDSHILAYKVLSEAFLQELKASLQENKKELETMNNLQSKNKTLQETVAQMIQELQNIKTENQNESEKMETACQQLKASHAIEVQTHKTLSETYLQDLNKQIKASFQSEKQYLEKTNVLQAENKTLQDIVAQKTQELSDKQKELEQMESSQSRLKARLKVEVPSEALFLSPNIPADEAPLKVSDGETTTPEKKKSLWKRTRHRLGLTKPKCWKK
nr:PREDICTED: coiled-coil domain-containing protein 158-like [Austrofundulus limnaeus]